MLNSHESRLSGKLRGANNFQGYFEHADQTPPVQSGQSATGLAQSARNPNFSAQFDVQVHQYYFGLTAGVYTLLTPAQLSAGLQNKLPVFLFGHADYAAGFAKLQQSYPLVGGWVYGLPGVVGKDAFTPYAFDANVKGLLQNGDMVVPFTAALSSNGSTSTLGIVVVRCTQVAYGSLLESISSDRFAMNMIRYVLPDVTQLNQYSQQIGIFYQSLFGKFNSDTVSPNSFKNPEQMQTNIIDIPLERGIAKQDALAFYNIYTNQEIDLSFFVFATSKVTA
jgi:hypothetical protein